MDRENIRKNVECGKFKLIQKRKGKSELWTIFAEVENDCGSVLDGWLGCRNCKMIYKYNGKNSSNLNRHKCFMNKVNNKFQKKMSEEIKKETMDVLANWMILDCRPFSAVSGIGFKKMADFFIKLGATHGECIDVQDLLPEPTTISRRINKMAVEEKEKIKENIVEIIKKNKASMTIDMWTDEYVRRNFLCATFHYEENLELKEIVLGIKSMDLLNSSGANIRKKLLTLLDDFGVTDLSNIKFITDRGANVKSALKDEIRLNCSNHILSNMIDAAFEGNAEILQIISSCKNLVKYFKKGNLQQFLPTTLKNHCPTRWNSYLHLFKSICDNWKEINNMLLEKGLSHRLNDLNHSTLNDLFHFCTNIDKISRKLQGTKYPTLCYVLPIITRLKIICQPKHEDAVVIWTLKENILREIEEKWIKNISIWHKIACFLFPPANNMEELQESIDLVTDFCKQQIMSNSEDEMTQNLSSSSYSINSSSSASVNSTQETSSSTDPSPKTVDDLEFFFPNLSNETAVSLPERADLDINLYIKEHIHLSKEFDCLVWWGQNEKNILF